jgi:hypothetical protein
MFKALVVYVVTPRDSLVELCDGDTSLYDALSESFCWNDQEGGQTRMTEEDRLLRMKILAFAFLLQEFTKLDDILGRPELDVTVFDRYWTVSRLETETSVENLVDDVAEFVEKRFAATGNPIFDAWINNSVSDS